MRRWSRDLLAFLAVVVVTFAARHSVADHYHIPTGSMEPTVHAGDRVVVYKSAYDLRLPFSDAVLLDIGQPERGDVVVLDSPDQDLLLLKRVVAIPGDRVSIQGGRLRINDAPVAVKFVDGTLIEQLGKGHSILLDQGGGNDLAEALVPTESFLVLGDNRGNSRDGRVFGWISRSAIRGRAAGVYRSKGAFTWRDL